MTECAEEFTCIMGILNIVCPRPYSNQDGTGLDQKFLPQDYGASRYGLSDSSWLLLVSARGCIEDTIVLLRINVPFYSSNKNDGEDQM